MKHLIFLLTFLIVLAPLTAESSPKSGALEQKGWGFLANELIRAGMDSNEVKKLFLDPRMPKFEPVIFKVKPKEPERIYRHFLEPRQIHLAASEMKRYQTLFSQAEKKYGVEREAIAAILLIESFFGRNTGKSPVIVRLARLANAANPENLKEVYKEVQKEGEPHTFEEVKKRGEYLFETFFPEVVAAVEISKKHRFNVYSLRGSFAGAFGIPQFLPTSYLRFGVDQNRDGKVSLFQIGDAIFSAANYLQQHGWTQPITVEKQRKALWAYNRSEAYGNAVLGVARKLQSKG